MSSPSLLWLRRDLRRADHPALAAAAADGVVHPVFVVDPRLWHGAGPVRRGWLAANLQQLEAAYDGHLTIRVGDPSVILPDLAHSINARAVHVSTETTPFGRSRDRLVRAALGCRWVETGSPYAVTPGRVTKSDGSRYQVFTPWARAWREHGWPAPVAEPAGLELAHTRSDPSAARMLDQAVRDCPVSLPGAGEEAARQRWAEFRPALEHYDTDRDRPDRDGTSRMSGYLKLGVVHPRTLLAELDQRSSGARGLLTELGWREFYADVLAHEPSSSWRDLRALPLSYDESESDLEAWREGRTGYPIVDAGMRQLSGSGWMHNRVRMITASFLVKDLHQWWPRGARHFLANLLDGDVASNNHGWQWVAGTGTDAAPYFRVFNPTTQGHKFDPQGDYVRRWVPELEHIPGGGVHEPWRVADGYDRGYPQRIVDHASERREALDRYQRAKGST